VTWKRKTVIRILLMVAEFLADEEWREEIHNLANHIAAEPTESYEVAEGHGVH